MKINFSNVASVFHFVDKEEGRVVKIKYNQEDKEKDLSLVLESQQQAQEWSEMLKEFLVAIDDLKTEEKPANKSPRSPLLAAAQAMKIKSATEENEAGGTTSILKKEKS